ncbi:adhesin [Gracilibacillus oryzae]|uniref:Adhesin n=1 Tax=Gracilibacillus oryzae TaxID=1672701 RepID=A0A7C8GVQ0_9BACI|nr:zinc ABC transporter substrate-binding protein [Gracilibacillus oryzae]KAB8139345.1 adhesin [Gracilibacillus oryzae]
MKKTSLLVLSFFFIILLAACGQEEQSEADSTGNQDTTAGTDAQKTNSEVIDIYTTLYPLQFFTKEIGGEYVNATSILPPGTDAHTFEPTSKLMVEIAEGDLFVYNGAEMESYASSIEDALQDEDVKIIEAAEGINLVEHTHSHEHGEEHSHGEHAHDEEEHSHEEHAHEEEGHDHDHGGKDPHIWLDPIKAIDLAENIKKALVELKPEQADYFEENFHNLEERLIALDESFHETIEQAPNKEILVTHAAYGYWEQSYGMEQIAISGISSSDEPSQKKIEEILNQVEESGIKYLLFEQNVEPKVAKVIQEEAQVEPLQLHNLATLTEENIENDETYFTLMEKNLEVLEKALQY